MVAIFLEKDAATYKTKASDELFWQQIRDHNIECRMQEIQRCKSGMFRLMKLFL
jgi:hypothetical protein